MAIGEEGSPPPRPGQAQPGFGGPTTMALGEEGSPPQRPGQAQPVQQPSQGTPYNPGSPALPPGFNASIGRVPTAEDQRMLNAIIRGEGMNYDVSHHGQNITPPATNRAPVYDAHARDHYKPEAFNLRPEERAAWDAAFYTGSARPGKIQGTRDQKANHLLTSVAPINRLADQVIANPEGYSSELRMLLLGQLRQLPTSANHSNLTKAEASYIKEQKLRTDALAKVATTSAQERRADAVDRAFTTGQGLGGVGVSAAKNYIRSKR
jgi:hypothetical protein